ncbi:LptA/OstA family protein [Granulicella sp. dw_53]|uniref:LptA/OstA family protein n=1 Tax=Granulicella sp. dw_53 TaxID=2719792 RepID=UPI001BD43F44|nr:LptA/OstA family protein [Granulicella sp. dw_53]
MIVSVERLRIWLLAGAALLVLVIAGFLGYAHYRAHRFIKDLPRKLGIDIRQETNGVTYSQSVKGKTIYTIHAAKTLQHKDGKVTLQDVGIVLYGRGDGSADRVDRIYGSEFEYDQNAGVVRAMGVVHIDLQAPAPVVTSAKVGSAAGHDAHGGKGNGQDEHLIHVKTSGLVFLQKLGVAATDQDLEFVYNGMTGHARGAEYNSDTGMLVLQSAVKMNGIKEGEPVVLTASRAELDRQKEQVVLARAVYTILGGGAGTRVAKADHVVAFLRHDGSVERGQGEGEVSLSDSAGGEVTAKRGEVTLNPQSQPETAVLTGDVRYTADEPLRQARGEAEEARGRFNKAGLLEHVTLTGGVHVHERTRAVETETVLWSERDLGSKGLELAVSSGSDKRLQLREAVASGDARLTVVNPPVAGDKAAKGPTTSAMSGDVLTALFETRDGGAHVKNVHGVGHTVLRRVSTTGATETSSGDTVDAEFRSGKVVSGGPPRSGKGVTAIGQGADEISTAVQQGHVVMTNLPVAKPGGVVKAKGSPGGGEEQRATADRAVYDGSTEKVTLTGTVEVSDTGSVIWADRVVMDQQTGDAAADGSVKATYQQAEQAGQPAAAAGEPVHILAVRAELKHDAGQAFFYGVAGRPARLWQGDSQVMAPVLQFEQRERRMVARGEDGDKGMGVHAVFVSTASPGTPGVAKKGETAKKPVPVRVTSHVMTYNDLARRADFDGGVLVEDADGTMRAQGAVVFLQAAGSAKAGDAGKKAPPQGAFMGGSVERMVASGRVEMTQPGRRATGDRLVYTASDGLFVMTGVPGTPPKMMDQAQGEVTGASLQFHAGDNSVVVSNGVNGAAGQRVRTETRVKQ